MPHEFEFPTAPLIESAPPKHGRKALGINLIVGLVVVLVLLTLCVIGTGSTAIIAITFFAVIFWITGFVMWIRAGGSDRSAH